MQMHHTTQRYCKSIIILHWLMALLMVLVYASIELREIFPKGSDPREAMKAMHFMLGLNILLLVALRIYLRIRSDNPAITPPLTPAQTQLAKDRSPEFVCFNGEHASAWLANPQCRGQAHPLFRIGITQSHQYR